MDAWRHGSIEQSTPLWVTLVSMFGLTVVAGLLPALAVYIAVQAGWGQVIVLLWGL